MSLYIPGLANGCIRIQKSASLRIIISAIQVVQPSFRIIIISSVQKGIQLTDSISFAAGCSKQFTLDIITKGSTVTINVATLNRVNLD